jgi:hypothetical protein
MLLAAINGWVGDRKEAPPSHKHIWPQTSIVLMSQDPDKMAIIHKVDILLVQELLLEFTNRCCSFCIKVHI